MRRFLSLIALVAVLTISSANQAQAQFEWLFALMQNQSTTAPSSTSTPGYTSDYGSLKSQIASASNPVAAAGQYVSQFITYQSAVGESGPHGIGAARPPATTNSNRAGACADFATLFTDLVIDVSGVNTEIVAEHRGDPRQGHVIGIATFGGQAYSLSNNSFRSFGSVESALAGEVDDKNLPGTGALQQKIYSGRYQGPEFIYRSPGQ